MQSGTPVTAPEPPTKEHYTFAGWHPELPKNMPTTNLTVTATWEPTVYHIGFDDGSGKISVLPGIFGSEVKAPKDPVREGSVFAGWNTEKNGTGEAVTFPRYMDAVGLMPVYAMWKDAQSAPDVNVASVDAYTVEVVEPVAGAEYALVPAGQQPAAKDWASAKKADEGDVVFGGLAPAASYDVWARMAETQDASQSEAVKVSVTTAKEAQVAPAAPSARADGPAAVVIEEPSAALEYALVPAGEAVPEDGGSWSSIDENGKVEWTGCAPNRDYDVYARYKETATKAASVASLQATVKTDKAAVQVTAPVAIAGLTANGTAQVLVQAGSAQGATMLYALGGNVLVAPAADAFAEAVPTATAAGTYYVWYYAAGDADHVDSAPACVTVTVAAPASTPEPAPAPAPASDQQEPSSAG